MPTHTSSVVELWLPQLVASLVDVAWREGSGSHSYTGLEHAGASGCGQRLLTWHHTDREGLTYQSMKGGCIKKPRNLNNVHKILLVTINVGSVKTII